MTAPYKLLYTPEAREGIGALTSDLKAIAERVLIHIAENPQSGKRLLGKFKGIYSARITRRYRMLYMINHKGKEVIVLDVKHRKEAYG